MNEELQDFYWKRMMELCAIVGPTDSEIIELKNALNNCDAAMGLKLVGHPEFARFVRENKARIQQLNREGKL